jgi:hypothetical protein
LIALTNVALLSFNMTEISKRIPEDGPTRQARATMHRFINSRVLEHISHSVPYLLGIDGKGPLATGRKSWRDALSVLTTGSRLITIDPTDLQVSLDRVASADTARQSGAERDGDGIYILAAGKIGGLPPYGQLYGTMFPILWVDVPGTLMQKDRRYTVIDGPVKILYIDASAIAVLEPAKRAALFDALSDQSMSPVRSITDDTTEVTGRASS